MSLKLGTTDISGVPTTLINTVNNKLDASTYTSNPRTNAVYITETYHSGSSWYRVWSDGWIEQGGVSPSGGDKSSQTISLLKNFNNTNYNILFAQNKGVEGSYTNGCTAKNKETSSFVLVYRTGGTASFYWTACGY